MQIATILLKLWRKRSLVACAALAGLLAGGLVAFRVSPSSGLHSRQYSVGTATARVLVDTPSSQVVAVDPSGLDSLAERADLIATLMVDGVGKNEIAALAGVAPNRIDGIVESASDQPPAASPKPRGWVLTTNVLTDTSGNQLPVVEIAAQAPTPTDAARLANAAVSGLQAYLDSDAATENVPAASRLRVTGLGAAQAAEVVRGPGAGLAAVIGMFVFLAGCAAIVLIPAVLRDWRIATEQEREQPAPVEVPAAPPSTRRSRPGRPRPGSPRAARPGTIEPSPVTESSASPQQILARDAG